MTKASQTPPTAGRRLSLHLQSRLLAGVLTIIPIMVVWVVVEFLLQFLSEQGRPLVQAMARALEREAPMISQFLLNESFQSVAAVLLILLMIYTVGALAQQVVGLRLIAFAESIIGRIPVVQTLYNATKQMLVALQPKPGAAQRVVLIAFPHPGMRAIGLLMAELDDPKTGRRLAAVYVPTTPNPTSGYLELVPLEDVFATDMSIEDAMSMIISGGTLGPRAVAFDGADTPPPPQSPPPAG